MDTYVHSIDCSLNSHHLLRETYPGLQKRKLRLGSYPEEFAQGYVESKYQE